MTSKFVKRYGITKRGLAKIYRKAAYLIDVHGLVKGSFGNYEDGFCALGAIGEAAGDLSAGKDTGGPLRKLVKSSIPHWNDDENRTKSEVTHALRMAAHKLEHGWSGV